MQLRQRTITARTIGRARGALFSAIASLTTTSYLNLQINASHVVGKLCSVPLDNTYRYAHYTFRDVDGGTVSPLVVHVFSGWTTTSATDNCATPRSVPVNAAALRGTWIQRAGWPSPPVVKIVDLCVYLKPTFLKPSLFPFLLDALQFNSNCKENKYRTEVSDTNHHKGRRWFFLQFTPHILAIYEMPVMEPVNNINYCRCYKVII